MFGDHLIKGRGVIKPAMLSNSDHYIGTSLPDDVAKFVSVVDVDYGVDDGANTPGGPGRESHCGRVGCLDLDEVTWHDTSQT